MTQPETRRPLALRLLDILLAAILVLVGIGVAFGDIIGGLIDWSMGR